MFLDFPSYDACDASLTVVKFYPFCGLSLALMTSLLKVIVCLGSFVGTSFCSEIYFFGFLGRLDIRLYLLQ